jgi:hypothetical protein
MTLVIPGAGPVACSAGDIGRELRLTFRDANLRPNEPTAGRMPSTHLRSEDSSTIRCLAGFVLGSCARDLARLSRRGPHAVLVTHTGFLVAVLRSARASALRRRWAALKAGRQKVAAGILIADRGRNEHALLLAGTLRELTLRIRAASLKVREVGTGWFAGTARRNGIQERLRGPLTVAVCGAGSSFVVGDLADSFARP